MRPQCPGPKESWHCLKIGKPQISIHAHHLSHSGWKMSGNIITACLEKHVLHQKRENCHDVQSFLVARGVARLAFYKIIPLRTTRAIRGRGEKTRCQRKCIPKNFVGPYLWDRLLYSSNPPVDSNVMQSQPALDCWL